MESYVKPDSIAKSKHVANQSFFFGERQKALWNDIRWMHKVKQLRNRMTAINVTSKLEKALVGRSFRAKIKQSRYTYNSDSNKSASFCIIQPIVWLPFFLFGSIFSSQIEYVQYARHLYTLALNPLSQPINKKTPKRSRSPVPKIENARQKIDSFILAFAFPLYLKLENYVPLLIVSLKTVKKCFATFYLCVLPWKNFQLSTDGKYAANCCQKHWKQQLSQRTFLIVWPEKGTKKLEPKVT